MAERNEDVRKPVVLGPGEGRQYEMGGMHAVFKAHGTDTQGRYNVSEWWLRNSGAVRAGALDFGVPGGFEKKMPELVAYFANTD